MTEVSGLDKVISVGTILLALVAIGWSASTVYEVHSQTCEQIIRSVNSSIDGNDSLKFYSEQEYSEYLDTGFKDFQRMEVRMGGEMAVD